MHIIFSFSSISFIIFVLFFLFSCAAIIFPSNLICLLSWNLFYNNSIRIKFQIILDSYGFIFAATVCFISLNVLIFANSYIKPDPYQQRFLILVLLFILSICLLIFIPHLVFLLLGWDGLGLVSFLLIIHYQTPNALRSGLITILTNRIGDVIILLSIILIFNQLTWIPNLNLNSFSPLIILSIILAGITKRAQIPFSAWLPAAIAAPTPVSALVHSSTLVTAGVFLLFRFYPTLSQIPFFISVLSISASLTIIIAGLRAFREFDIKKIIALSTLSQLGLIITRLSLNQLELTFFHLLTHAIFKALLFICAGNIILQFSHSQDLRQFGNILNFQPITRASLIISKFALCGIPFIAGFYSKDIIIETALQSHFNLFIIFIFLSGVILTLLYSLRFIIFILPSPSLHPSLTISSRLDKHLNIPIIFISLYVISWGRTLNWLLIKPALCNNFLDTLKFLTPLTIILSISLFKLLYQMPLSLKLPKSLIYFSASIWFITSLSTQILLKTFTSTPLFLYKIIDRGWIEISSSKGLRKTIILNTKIFISWQNSLLTSHMLGILIFLSIYIFF